MARLVPEPPNDGLMACVIGDFTAITSPVRFPMVESIVSAQAIPAPTAAGARLGRASALALWAIWKAAPLGMPCASTRRPFTIEPGIALSCQTTRKPPPASGITLENEDSPRVSASACSVTLVPLASKSATRMSPASLAVLVQATR